MRSRWPIVAILVLAMTPIVVRGTTATPAPEATPAATPVAFTGCDDLGAYFDAVATLANGSDGYRAVRAHPDGVFQADSTAARARVASLEHLLASLAVISPPAGATAWHRAFIGIVTWYRDLAAAPDMASYQRIVNRDKTLIPALSRATIAGQAACGSEAWQRAYDAAFGGR